MTNCDISASYLSISVSYHVSASISVPVGKSDGSYCLNRNFFPSIRTTPQFIQSSYTSSSEISRISVSLICLSFFALPRKIEFFRSFSIDISLGTDCTIKRQDKLFFFENDLLFSRIKLNDDHWRTASVAMTHAVEVLGFN